MDNKKRSMEYDLIRVVAMIFVIALHAPDQPLENYPLLHHLARTVLLASNALFYLISGRFNLMKTFETGQDYKLFYKKKAVTILFPFVFATFALCGAALLSKGEFTPLHYLEYTYRFFMKENNESHLWFLYPLMGFLLSTPFLSKMLQAMKPWELKLMLIIGLAWNTVSLYLTVNIGVGFAFSGWILSGYLIFYAGGYFLKEIVTENNKKWFYLAGLIGLAVTAAGRTYFPDHFQSATSSSPAFVLFGFAVYIFLESHGKIRNRVVQAVIARIVPYTFWVYLFHMAVMNHIVLRFVSFGSVWLNFAAEVFLTLILSIALGFILETVLMRPLKSVTGDGSLSHISHRKKT